MLYKLYKKQVEAWKERFWAKIKELGFHLGYLQKPKVEKLRDFISSSRHKDTIELLEAIIKEVEGKKKTNCGCPPFHPNHNGPCDDKDHSELNSALSDLLTKLQAEKELIEVQECKDGKCIVGNLGRCIICNKK